MTIFTPATRRPLPMLGAIVASTLLLAGCHNTPTGMAAANSSAFVPPREVPAAPMPGQTPDTPVTAYIGKHPHDPVNGVMFFDRTDIANALLEAVPDNAIRRHISEVRGPEKPIFARGRLVGAAGCDARDCAGRDWTFLFDPQDATAEACYHDTATMQDSSRWFQNGVPTMREGPCPTA